MTEINTDLQRFGRDFQTLVEKLLSDAENNSARNFDKLAAQAMRIAKTHLEFLAQTHNRTGRLAAGYTYEKDGSTWWIQNQAPKHGFISNFKDSAGFLHVAGKFIPGSDSYTALEDVIMSVMEDMNFD